MIMAKSITMQELSLSSFLLILLLVSFSCPEASGGGCDLQYLKAPPSRIFCNPYSQSARLMLECQIQVLAPVGNRVKIQWFFTSTRQATLHITDPTTFPPLLNISDIEKQTIMDGDLWILSSSITFSSLTSPTHQGMYFCQVVLDGNITSFSPSDSVLVENEDESDYLNLHPCSRVFVKDTMRCAGNMPSSSTASATTSFSTTSYSTTSSLTTPASVSTTATPISTTPSNISITMYLLIAVPVVFGVIIVVLSILSVGLCIKKIKTSKHARNINTSMTMAPTEVNGLSAKKELEADDDMTINGAYGIVSQLRTIPIL